MKKIVLVIITGVFLTSCKNNQKNDKTNKMEENKTTDNNWIYGKTYTQEGTPHENPEYGGLDFLIFTSKEKIELKTGDIVSLVKATFEGNKLILEDNLSHSKRIFTIVNKSCLTDEYGVKWFENKQEKTEEITKKTWKIIEIEGINVKGDVSDFYLKLDSNSNTIDSKAGCNVLNGDYTIKEGEILFTNITSSKMLCIEGMETEKKYLNALGVINNFEVENTILKLKKDNQIIVKLELIK
jgi:heat shock protein HslJ